MASKPTLFDQAAAALEQAMKTSSLGEQERLMDEAMRLNRLALEAERRGQLTKIAEESSVSPEDEQSDP